MPRFLEQLQTVEDLYSYARDGKKYIRRDGDIAMDDQLSSTHRTIADETGLHRGFDLQEKPIVSDGGVFTLFKRQDGGYEGLIDVRLGSTTSTTIEKEGIFDEKEPKKETASVYAEKYTISVRITYPGGSDIVNYGSCDSEIRSRDNK